MAAPKDPKGLYHSLGLDVNADETDIRKAYRRLALKCHPDKNQGNENATAEFQKIANAYEVLSDPKRRAFYDSTGCVDEEEFGGEDGFVRAEDLFAAFFGGGMAQDLDDEEQAMLDEFLRMTSGAFSFKAGRSRKKGRNRRAKVQATAFEQAFMAAMAGPMMGGMAEVTCPAGHTLKRKKADGGYECDVCQEDILDGKRFFDCRKCDFSMCLKCHKKAAAAMEEEEEEDEEEQERELFEAFFEMNIRPERQGAGLRFRCNLCGTLLKSQEEAAEHLLDEHAAAFQMVSNQVRAELNGGYGASSSSGFGLDGLEAFILGAMEDPMGLGPMGPGRPLVASPASSSTLNGPAGGAASSRDAAEELQAVRRARSAGRVGVGDSKDAKDPKATSAPRRDSPLRNLSPKGVKPRRASPVRKQGPREVSRSPEPPRARPPSARDVQASPGGDRNEQTDDLAQPTSFVQSLARLALVLERNGQAGTGAAAAATAVAAVVAKQGDDGLGDIHQYLQAPDSNRKPREAEQLRSTEEAIGIRARCARLEHEVAELRVQLSRRLDQAAMDVAASRQAAETATAQVAALRAELAAIIGNGEEVKPKFAAEDQVRHWPQQLI